MALGPATFCKSLRGENDMPATCAFNLSSLKTCREYEGGDQDGAVLYTTHIIFVDKSITNASLRVNNPSGLIVRF